MENIESLFDFNFNLAAYIDDSWLENITYGDIIKNYRDNSLSTPYLSHYLIQHFNLTDHYDFNISDHIKDFVFLPPEEFIILLSHVGAVINAESIRKVINGRDIELLKQEIGENAYYYGLRRASMFKNVPIIESAKIDAAQTLGKCVIQSGVNTLLAIVNDLSEAVKRRLLIKTPYQWRHSSIKKINKQCVDNAIKIFSTVQSDILSPSKSTPTMVKVL